MLYFYNGCNNPNTIQQGIKRLLPKKAEDFLAIKDKIHVIHVTESRINQKRHFYRAAVSWTPVIVCSRRSAIFFPNLVRTRPGLTPSPRECFSRTSGSIGAGPGNWSGFFFHARGRFASDFEASEKTLFFRTLSTTSLEMVKTSPPPFDLAETGLSSDA